MPLKVIRYINYGCTMVGEQSNLFDFEQRFYWSFYELNNGSIITVQYIENWNTNRKINEDDLHMTYSNYELKNGRLIRYEFGQDFYNWFHSTPSMRDQKKLTWPTEKEIDCIQDFFYFNVYDYVFISSGVIKV